ncbi:MAG TPA: serine/threonine-protein kinase [Thermoanaerobaculia bacterium]|jgi:tetratricopeptide (TPR) repeat protein/predicted Ser/Thr protein kinase|nr:serine/threonine-protein kinase [Thermoanaerobaculia bacterium]
MRRRWRDATQTIQGLPEQDAVSAPAGEERTDGDGIGSPGSRLGRYVILYRLGSGGMGVVFAAYDPELDRKVALKQVRLETGSPAAREALRREAQAMARLSHPNIVAVHDVGGDGHDVFLAMDLIDGVTLDEWLKLGKRGWRDVLRVFVQAGRGLAAAHAAGVVHHDFSPRNVLVTAEDKALIADFGLARALEGPDVEPPDEAVRGTPAYLAPERLLGVDVDPRSDQFSFCAALYRALYGTVPFPADRPADSPALYLERVERGDMAPPRDGRRVPRRLLTLLRRGLDIRPENRFATMPELLGRLEAALRRPRVLLFTAVTVPLAAAAVIVLLGPLAQVPPPDRLAGVWSAAQRQSVRKALLRLDPATGTHAASRLESEVDAYAARWRAIDEDGHRTALRDGAGLVRDRQRLCLDARRAELRALISRLEVWQDRSLEPAVRAVQGLSDLGSCADVRVLRDLKAPAPDARIRRAMVPLQDRLEEQFTLLETGAVPDVARVDWMVAEADRLGYPPLVLRAHEIRGSIRMDRGLPGAQADFEAALQAAVASADPIGQARMFGLLARDVGLVEGRFADARLWRGLAESGLAALGPGHEEVEVRVLQSLGAAAQAEGDSREAARRYRRSLALAERLWGKDSTRLPPILSNLAVAVGGKEGGSQTAMALLRRALSIGERAYGPDSPIVANPLFNLASQLATAGFYREAIGLTQRVIRIQERYYGARFRDIAYPLILSGQILIALDEPEEALAALDRTMELVREGYGEGHHLVVEAWCARADGELARLRTDAAAASIARCHAGVAGTLPPTHPVFITLRRLEGEVELARGRTARARTILAEAAGMPGAVKLETVQILAPRAEAELAAGDLAAARQAGEAGLALGNPASDPALVGRLRFALARALIRTDTGRAIGLTRQAVKDLSQGGPRTRSLRARAVAWLDAHQGLAQAGPE